MTEISPLEVCDRQTRGPKLSAPRPTPLAPSRPHPGMMTGLKFSKCYCITPLLTDAHTRKVGFTWLVAHQNRTLMLSRVANRETCKYFYTSAMQLDFLLGAGKVPVR
jgi:hypothetical protein